jgi:rhodanese-related sulfurtransferase
VCIFAFGLDIQFMKKITPTELRQWINMHKPFKLIDVREVWEHMAFNIGGGNIPLGEIITRKKEIDNELPVVIYCEKGIRSAIAIQRLEALGFDKLYNLQSGITEWRQQP